MISATSASASVRSSSRSPFTATQWQELEHQALIFKYMVSGVPIPPDLIYSVKRSLDSAPFPSRLFSHHPSGWGCFEMGFGRKVDPEPGRCRRTDGKKWRCSKEAYPDSKYCERHMHRGRNRSRKHVEVSSSSSSPSLSSSSSTPTTSTQTQPITTTAAAILSQTSIPTQQVSSYSHSLVPDHHHSSSLYPYASYNNNNNNNSNPDSSSSRPTDHYASASPYFCLKAEPYSNASPTSDKDYNRYFQGSKESMDELAFFPEASVNVNNARGFADSSCHPLMGYNRGYNSSSNTQAQYHHQHHDVQSLADTCKDPIKQSAEDQQHCFILGTDFKSERSLSSSSSSSHKASLKDHSETQKPLHHFFGEWPPKNTPTDSWLDLASNSRVPNDG